MLTLLECTLDGWSFTKCVLFVSSEIKMAALTVNKTLEVKQLHWWGASEFPVHCLYKSNEWCRLCFPSKMSAIAKFSNLSIWLYCFICCQNELIFTLQVHDHELLNMSSRFFCNFFSLRWYLSLTSIKDSYHCMWKIY